MLPSSQQKFAWNSDRIAHELVQKMEQVTRRRTDHMRKLLWTVGTDPYFSGPVENAMHITPDNFDRICDRFGLVCSKDHAKEIFQKHGLPESGANVYEVTKKFIDSPQDTATMVRKHQQAVLGVNPRGTPRSQPQTGTPRDAYKFARLPETAWDNHRPQTAAGAAGSSS